MEYTPVKESRNKKHGFYPLETTLHSSTFHGLLEIKCNQKVFLIQELTQQYFQVSVDTTPTVFKLHCEAQFLDVSDKTRFLTIDKQDSMKIFLSGV